MDRESLLLLIALAETGSFSAAADRLSISQSAASQRLRALESVLNVRLLERGRGLPRAALTEAGELTLAAAREILARWEALERTLAEQRDSEPGGALSVATVYSIGLHTLTPALNAFLTEYPQVNLRLQYLRTDRIYDALLAGTIDCGIVACPRERAGVEVVALADEPMVAIVAPRHPLAQRVALGAPDLEGQNFVAFDSDIPTRGLIDAWLSAGGTVVRVVQAFDNIETIKRVVEIGLGIAIVPEPTVRREVRDGALVVLPLQGGALNRPTGVLLRRGAARSRALERFLGVLAPEREKPDPVSYAGPA
jgi:LysR family transcriptional regulator, transcriptional activator of the cysJI operon